MRLKSSLLTLLIPDISYKVRYILLQSNTYAEEGLWPISGKAFGEDLYKT